MPDRAVAEVPELDAATIARFWAKVDRHGPDDCWPWTDNRYGGTEYGQFRIGERGWGAHRVAARIAFGRPPEGRPMTLHSCDHQFCCNPAHLRYGTQADNVRDKQERGRQANGERIGLSRLTAAKVAEIRALYRRGHDPNQDALAKMFGVSSSTIHYVVTGQTWRHVA